MRRAPEEARATLLDAAEALFSERGPDAVGLRDIAQKAGVSHGLIRHYFGTYEGLVEAVFARRAQRISLALVARLERAGSLDASASPFELIQLLLSSLSEPVHLRLVAWAMLSGRSQSVDFLPGRQQGMRAVADAVHRAATLQAERAGAPGPSREDVDYAVMLALSAAYGYGLGKAPLLRALGRKPTSTTDADVMQRLSDMVQGLLAPKL